MTSSTFTIGQSPIGTKFVLDQSGTESNPIVINGVTNSSGDRPTISGEDATSVNPEVWNSYFTEPAYIFYLAQSSHLTIKNLRFIGANESNSHVHDGETMPYHDFSAGIRSRGAKYITVEGSIFEDNSQGIYVQSVTDAMSQTWTVRGSKFVGNGYGDGIGAGSHQVYFQAVSGPGEYNIFEGNYFDTNRPGERVAQLKVRGTGTVIRYNRFTPAIRVLDIVEGQDGIPDWIHDNFTEQEVSAYYSASFIYGNVFAMDLQANGTEDGGSFPLHFGADAIGGTVFPTSWGYESAAEQPAIRGYDTPTYFFHNTFYMRADGAIFDADSNAFDYYTQEAELLGQIESWNNVFELAGSNSSTLVDYSGISIMEGANLLYTDTLASFSDANSNALPANFDVVTNGTLITQSASLVDPHNTNLAAKNFRLTAASPAIDAAVALPPELAGFPVDLQPAGVNGGAVVRPTTDDLGALEYGR